MTTKKPKKETAGFPQTAEIIGIVIPIAWAEDSSPTEFAISAYDEQEYQIDARGNTGQGDWQNVMGKKIKATGMVRQVDKHRKKIKVADFWVVPE
jgi:hypothetical protein